VALTAWVYDASDAAPDAELDVVNVMSVLMKYSMPDASVSAIEPVASGARPASAFARDRCVLSPILTRCPSLPASAASITTSAIAAEDKAKPTITASARRTIGFSTGQRRLNGAIVTDILVPLQQDNSAND